MSGQPPDSTGTSFIAFITSVTTDIYERIDKITHSLEAVKISLNELINSLNDNLSKITGTIDHMIEQGEMNKEITLEAFADTKNNLIQQIRTIRNEHIEGLRSTQTQEMIDAVNTTANVLEARMYDIQIAMLINGIHALVNAIKSGKVVGMPVPIKDASANASVKQELTASVPTLSTQDPSSSGKKSFFGKGARKKTHDEIMEEKRKKNKLFGKYK